MRDYKDETIEKLCAVLNILEDCGCLLGEEKDEYRAIISEYITAQTETKDNRFGPHSHEGNLNYIAYSIYGDPEIHYIHYAEDAGNKLLRDASKMICFSDCTDEIVEAIVVQGWKVDYMGWQPGMLYEFRDQETGEIIYSNRFPEWDH
jgi:hypothetical protein